MLHTEFYERTKVHLTADQYAEVEKIYNACEMDKDLFCRVWLEIKDNELVYRLCSELTAKVDKLELENSDFQKDQKELVSEIEKLKSYHEKDLLKQSNIFNSRLNDFGRKIVENLGSDQKIYDAVEEEFGLDFIIKIKLENDFDLEQHERDYIIKALNHGKV